MDRETAKALLEAYQRGTDATDPLFAEALALLERDPELAAWFAEKEQFDALMAEKLSRAVAPPPGLKQQILLGTRLGDRRRRWRRWRTAAGAAAAVVLLVFGIWHFARQPRGPAELVALAAIEQMNRMAALQFVSNDAAEVANWVNEQPLARSIRLRITKPVQDMRLIGASVVEVRGKPVVVLCLQNERKIAHAYVFRAEEFGVPENASGIVVEHEASAAKLISSPPFACVLTTRGTSADLDFDVPL